MVIDAKNAAPFSDNTTLRARPDFERATYNLPF